LEFKQVKLIYFSPTGTTRKVLESIAEGIAAENVAHIDVTLPEGAHQTVAPFSDELVLIGAPVYGGRLPVDAIERFKQLKARNALAVLIVTYGNREFDDALLELRHLAVALGFKPLAGGAFIGEHSFATKDVPIANGRPDGQDVQKAQGLGAKIKDTVAALQSVDDVTDFEVPGSFPYEAGGARPMAVSPVTREEVCTRCETCADVCPNGAVSIDAHVATEIERCIRCCACIKNCPTGARVMAEGKWKDVANWLTENCSTWKAPQVFGIDG
jgi:ferredoxin